MPKKSQFLLAGDIGGTKTKLAIYHPKDGPRHPLAEATFPSADFASLEALVAEFLKRKSWSISKASFGIAGPVVDGRVQVTNLPWVVDERTLSADLGAPVHILNDLTAIAQGIPCLEAEDLVTLNAGTPAPNGAIAVIAPGTGLGEAFLVWNGDTYVPCASEGGHTDFGPTNPAELELLSYLLPRLGHVNYEWVCSGLGLPNIYTFLRDTGRYPEPEWLRSELFQAKDVTPVIVQAAVAGQAEICVETLRVFVSILGSEAGNLALKVLATGGVYLGGGIPARILSFLTATSFMQAFTAKGRFSEMLAKIPVHVIRNPEAGLFGAACHGLKVGKEDA
jgi:glucokinase